MLNPDPFGGPVILKRLLYDLKGGTGSREYLENFIQYEDKFLFL